MSTPKKFMGYRLSTGKDETFLHEDFGLILHKGKVCYSSRFIFGGVQFDSNILADATGMSAHNRMVADRKAAAMNDLAFGELREVLS